MIGAIVRISGILETDSPTEVVVESAVRPNNLAALPDGRVLVVDASRRIYGVDASSPTPVPLGCLPRLADPTANIGFDIKDTWGYGAVSSPSSKATRKGSDEYRTMVSRVELRDGEAVPDKPIELRSTQPFAAENGHRLPGAQ